jgi:hypothetical protein
VRRAAGTLKKSCKLFKAQNLLHPGKGGRRKKKTAHLTQKRQKGGRVGNEKVAAFFFCSESGEKAFGTLT